MKTKEEKEGEGAENKREKGGNVRFIKSAEEESDAGDKTHV